MNYEDKLYWYEAKVINVVDGDTVDCLVSLPFYATLTLRLRLLHINAPEMHGESAVEGHRAMWWLTGMVLNKKVLIRTHKSDSFGRWLAEIYLDNVNINQEMLSLGYAEPYR